MYSYSLIRYCMWFGTLTYTKRLCAILPSIGVRNGRFSRLPFWIFVLSYFLAVHLMDIPPVVDKAGYGMVPYLLDGFLK